MLPFFWSFPASRLLFQVTSVHSVLNQTNLKCLLITQISASFYIYVYELWLQIYRIYTK